LRKENSRAGVHALLTVNTGSSSVKIAVYANDPTLRREAGVSVDRIGSPQARLKAGAPSDAKTEEIQAGDHEAALRACLDYLEEACSFTLDAVGHRVVHGGPAHAQPERITPSLLASLRELEPIDPGHMPQALAAVDSIARRRPSVPQFACFDTAFHRSMPPVARRYPLPPWTEKAGVLRYGFHGLSCEFIVGALGEIDRPALDGRVLIAHLGNGASVTAVRRGVSVDTTMGFSPCGGLMMGTRSGDIDPTVLTYLARVKGCDPDRLQRLVNEESGLLGVSGSSSDMRDLLGQTGSAAATDAIELYCYIARKHFGALASALGGVDTIVFTGGIGEHAAPIRDRICGGLEHLGVRLDPRRNAAGEAVISRSESRVTVRVMATDEDVVIARHVRRLLA
jgi:acetate kinase